MSVFGAMTPRRARQLWYAPVLGLSTALMMVRLLALARLLDVPNFAHLSVALLVAGTFVMLGCLGLQALLQREMPVMLVRGRERAARVLLAQSVLVAYACALAALPFVLLLPTGFAPSLSLLLLGLLHGLSQQMFVIASVESRSRGEPLRFAWQSLVRSLIVITAGLATAVATRNAQAVVAAEALASLLLAHRILWSTLAGTRPALAGLARVALRRLARLDWHAAFVLLLVSLLGFALANVDRWAAASLLDVNAFGSYSFAATVITIGIGLQALLNASVYPMLARLYAREGEAACYRLTARLSLLLLGASLVLAVPVHFLLAEAIRLWYPKYEWATGLLPLFLVAAAFRVSDFWSSYLMITGLHRRLLKINLLAGLAGGAAWLLLARPWTPDPSPQRWALLCAALAFAGHTGVAWASRVARQEASR